MSNVSCDSCGEQITEALSRTVSISVDESEIDSQTLCPNCFADWIDRYERRMQSEPAPSVDGIDFIE
jgi:uncharacterized protein CbrC (UPF0167 family)